MTTVNGTRQRCGRGARAPRRIAAALLAGVLLALAGRAAAAGVANVTVENATAGCVVRGEFRIAVPESIAWAVLTDYDHIGSFVSSMRSSEVLRRDGDSLLVRQRAVGHLWFVRRELSVTLAVYEVPRLAITFRDVAGHDFRTYVGAWRLVPDGGTLCIQYELEADPRAALPRRLCRGALRGAAEELLAEVRAEIARRGARPATAN